MCTICSQPGHLAPDCEHWPDAFDTCPEYQAHWYKSRKQTPIKDYPPHPVAHIVTQHYNLLPSPTPIPAPSTPEKTSEPGYARLQEQYKALRITAKVLEDCNRDLTKENERLIQENLNLWDDLAHYKSALRHEQYAHGKAEHLEATAKNLFKDTT